MGRLAQAFATKTGDFKPGGLDLLRHLMEGFESWTGKTISLNTALSVSTMHACARVIGEGVAQVPLKLMLQSADGKRRVPARDHPLYDVLARRPNDWQTSFEYREMLCWHVIMCGNAFSFINRVSTGRIVELIPFLPEQVTVTQNSDRSISYRVRGVSGQEEPFPAESIWHVRGPSWNSWMGLEAMHLARQALGLAMAIEEQQSRMQKNGVQTSGIYSVEGTLKDDQYKALKEWIDKNHAGAKNAGSAMVLDRSAKWLNTSMTAVDAQQLETRRFQVEEICRHFRVNPIMVGAESKNTTYASAEQMFLAHVVHCLAPWYQRLEQSADVNLLTEKERQAGYYTNFVDDGLLRGSMSERKDIILGYTNGGLMTANEGRALLDLPPDADPASNTLRVPANITGDVQTSGPPPKSPK